MNLVEVLRSCREQTTATLDALDQLIAWAERVDQVLSVMGGGGTSLAPRLNGTSKPTIAKAEPVAASEPVTDGMAPIVSTRVRIIQAAKDWMDLGAIQGALPDTEPQTVASAVGRLTRSGELRRRGTSGTYQYMRRSSIPANPGRVVGATRARIAALASDWVAGSALIGALKASGLTPGQIGAGIRNMIASKELRQRGERGAREYKAKE